MDDCNIQDFEHFKTSPPILHSPHFINLSDIFQSSAALFWSRFRVHLQIGKYVSAVKNKGKGLAEYIITDLLAMSIYIIYDVIMYVISFQFPYASVTSGHQM